MIVRCLTVLSLIVGLGIPVRAEDLTTRHYLVKNGAVIKVMSSQGRPIEMHVTYREDGTSLMTGLGPGELSGRWRAVENSFCTSNEMSPAETCFDIPPGKKPGDTFSMTTALGEASLTIGECSKASPLRDLILQTGTAPRPSSMP